jgi:hypothetical protein
MTGRDWPAIEQEIGLVCRCMTCCCSPTSGHNHPLYDEWLKWKMQTEANPFSEETNGRWTGWPTV